MAEHYYSWLSRRAERRLELKLHVAETVFKVLRMHYRGADGQLVLDKNGKPKKALLRCRPDPDASRVWVLGPCCGE
jgi:hypothetical protein